MRGKQTSEVKRGEWGEGCDRREGGGGVDLQAWIGLILFSPLMYILLNVIFIIYYLNSSLSLV